MPRNGPFKLDELASLAGTSPRTVRYYVQRGLLPAPMFRGKDTAYSREHLARLRAIRHLQARFFPLDAIETELARLTPQELEALAASSARTPTAHEAPADDATPKRPLAKPERASRWARWQLAPGLELLVAEGATAAARDLAVEIRELARRKS